MNTRRTVEIALFAAVLATAAFAFRSSPVPPPSPVSGRLQRQEKIVQTFARQAEESRVPVLLVGLPITVLLLLLQD
ncbi:MAG: hypothetical protein HY302_09390 [Opitutae bacterium]|nr:hypothetical protein [Opitutae bacterium]